MLKCQHCGEDLELRNPSGYCDHLYYPDQCPVCAARWAFTPPPVKVRLVYEDQDTMQLTLVDEGAKTGALLQALAEALQRGEMEAGNDWTVVERWLVERGAQLVETKECYLFRSHTESRRWHYQPPRGGEE